MQDCPSLNPRQVCQRLREAALGILPLRREGATAVAGLLTIEIDGWHLLLDFDGTRLLYCHHCRSTEGAEWPLDSRQRLGTDPLSLLSTWELAQLERLLQAPSEG